MLWYFADTPGPSISTSLPRSVLIRYALLKEIVRENGLFEPFLINKVRENVEIREIENIQLPLRTHSELMGTCSFELAIVCIHT